MSTRSETFRIPTLEPPTLGLTNSGRGSRSQRARNAFGSASKSRRDVVSKSTTGTPDAASWRLASTLSMAMALVVTPHPT